MWMDNLKWQASGPRRSKRWFGYACKANWLESQSPIAQKEVAADNKQEHRDSKAINREGKEKDTGIERRISVSKWV